MRLLLRSRPEYSQLSLSAHLHPHPVLDFSPLLLSQTQGKHTSLSLPLTPSPISVAPMLTPILRIPCPTAAVAPASPVCLLRSHLYTFGGLVFLKYPLGCFCGCTGARCPHVEVWSFRVRWATTPHPPGADLKPTLSLYWKWHSDLIHKLLALLSTTLLPGAPSSSSPQPL